jgi:regulatory protein
MHVRGHSKLDLEALRAYALKALARRDHSAAELSQKLKQRAANHADVDTVIRDLQSYGYLNDRHFAESFASARAGTRVVGGQRVARDLLQKRVAAPVVREAVSRAFEGTDETALIREFLARKMRGKDLTVWLREPKNLASLYRRLRTAGFSTSASIRVLKNYHEAAEELETLEDPAGEE